MNAVLQRILETKTVTDGTTTYPLHSNMKPDEGELIQRVIASVQPLTSLEIGMAYGISTLFVCDALAKVPRPARHIAIDPHQTSGWHGIGMANVREAGFERFVELYEEGSEFALPRLLAEKVEVQVAIIDGWHTFDHALLDFFYINRMLPVGGVVILDDVGYESIHHLVRHILTYPAYKLFGTVLTSPGGPSLLGRMRRALGRMPVARQLLHPALLNRPWDLGWGSCVARQKVAPDDRSWDWYEEF